MSAEDFVYSRIGMALVSAQRVEFVAKELVIYLKEFDPEFYGLTTEEFLSKTPEADKLRTQTMGRAFYLLKLNPKLVVADVLDSYVKQRNELVHGFWPNYLHTKSDEQIKRAVDFCFSFGHFSKTMESFFKGFVFMLALRLVPDRDHLSDDLKEWSKDFDFFMHALTKKSLL